MGWLGVGDVSSQSLTGWHTWEGKGMSTAEEWSDGSQPTLPRGDLEPEIVIDLRDPHRQPTLRPFLTGSQGLLAASSWQLALKRLIDILGSVLALVLLSPVLAAVAAAVAVTSPGPVFFRQERVGRDGTTFTFYKFRSMRDGADAAKAELASFNEATGPVFKIRDDPRCTPIGRFLRVER